MSGDRPLFTLPTPRHARGRVRTGLEVDVRAAHVAGGDLPASGVAALRSLADQIDQLERQLRDPKSKPYARLPLVELVKQFDATFLRVFGAAGLESDPLTRALAEFIATTSVQSDPDRTD